MKENKKGLLKDSHSHRHVGAGSRNLVSFFNEDFLSFIAQTTPTVDFFSFCGDASYSRLRVPSAQIPESVVKAINKWPDGVHGLKPNFHPRTQNCKLFGAGPVSLDSELRGVEHLRIEYQGYARLYIATQDTLNAVQASECLHWFRASMGWPNFTRDSEEAEQQHCMPVPFRFSDGTQHATCTRIKDKRLKVPDFPTRATFMIDAEIPGWEFDTYNLNQRTQIEPMLLHSTYPKSVYSQALGIAFFELASKVHEEDEIISMIANYLSAHLEKYRISRGAALDLASKYLEKAIQHNFELNK